MRSTFVALAYLCISSATAHAQQSLCSVVREVADNAGDEFESIQGRVLRQSSYSTNYATSLVLPGAQSCRISHRSRGISYACEFSGGPYEANALVGDISRCLGRAPEFVNSGGGASAFIETDLVEFSISYENGDEVILVSASQP